MTVSDPAGLDAPGKARALYEASPAGAPPNSSPRWGRR